MGSVAASNNQFHFNFLQNFVCAIHYAAFYAVADNEDGDEYRSSTHSLNVTSHGPIEVRLDFGFEDFIGWEAETWLHILIQNVGTGNCTIIGLAPSEEATLILNGFHSTIRPDGAKFQITSANLSTSPTTPGTGNLTLMLANTGDANFAAFEVFVGSVTSTGTFIDGLGVGHSESATSIVVADVRVPVIPGNTYTVQVEGFLIKEDQITAVVWEFATCDAH